jgi:hypothetical protein
MNLPIQKNEKDRNLEYEAINNNDNTSIESEKKLNFFEMNLKFSNKINIDYSDFDFQKGEQSPKFLFRKRRFQASELKQQNNLKDERNNNNNITNKIFHTPEDTSIYYIKLFFPQNFLLKD